MSLSKESFVVIEFSYTLGLLISQLSSMLAEKAISTNERGLTSTDWTVYNEGTKRTRCSTEPTSNITAKIVVADGFTLPQKDTADITTSITRSFTAEGIHANLRRRRQPDPGEKTSTGIWTVTYNAENRPVTFTRSEEDGMETQVTCTHDYIGRRTTKKVTTNGTVTLHQRYIYRGYLQIACCDQTRANHPSLWLITWDPTQPIATRPLAIRKDGTWYAYGWDLTKNICEVLSSNGYIRTAYTYTPYGEVTSSGNTTQPLQWSSEYSDTELGLVYYNYRHYNPVDGRWLGRDVFPEALYVYCLCSPDCTIDVLGLKSRPAGRNSRPAAQRPRTNFRGTPKRKPYQIPNESSLGDALLHLAESLAESLWDTVANFIFNKDEIEQQVTDLYLSTLPGQMKPKALEECRRQRESLQQKGVACENGGCCVMTVLYTAYLETKTGVLAVLYKYSQSPCSNKPAGEPTIYDPKTSLAEDYYYNL